MRSWNRIGCFFSSSKSFSSSIERSLPATVTLFKDLSLFDLPNKLAGAPANGIVLDPFFGSGTTGLVALKHGRNFVGVELNPEYIKNAENRLSDVQLELINEM
ncbi:DNA methyltransferase [Bacillus sp. FSL K6-3431]|uniref:DNA methyltransferase n=1 Tax=Bacillus sp. FSL K6-3431 TaxID=2921500 RepID=UPI0040468910